MTKHTSLLAVVKIVMVNGLLEQAQSLSGHIDPVGLYGVQRPEASDIKHFTAVNNSVL